jgi:hypothetical protein
MSGEIPKRSNGADCKSVGSAFVGSNPALPTMTSGAIAAGAALLFGRVIEIARVSRGAQAEVAQLVERQPSKL